VTAVDYERDDPTFLADLRASRDAVEIAAQWLASRGYPVIVRPTFERPSVERMADYADGGDLEIVQRVEVKRRIGLTFTSRDDFPHDTVIVDACHCYDRAVPKPYAYLILNRDMTCALCVNVRDTVSSWHRTERLDRHKNRIREFYECPVALVSCAQIRQEVSA
jgi:hypothetical protein